MAKKKNLLQSMEEDRRNRRTFRQAMAKELREHKRSFLVFSVLRILVIVSLVRQIMRGSYESAFFCLLALCLLYLPSWLQVKLRIELPPPKSWGRSTPFTWWSPTGTPCSTPSTAFWPRRWASPWSSCSTTMKS